LVTWQDAWEGPPWEWSSDRRIALRISRLLDEAVVVLGKKRRGTNRPSTPPVTS